MELARQSDVLTVHVPASKETKNLISAQVLAALPKGALFVNTSRADVVDQKALLDEAQSGRLRAAMDVYENEPKGSDGPFQSPLAALPNVLGTHHVGASTDQSQEAIAEETVRIVGKFIQEGVVPHCVNVAKFTPARYQLIRVSTAEAQRPAANVLDLIREAGINAQELENTIFEGAAAACCKIQLDSKLPDEVLGKIRARQEEIIFADLVALASEKGA